LATSGRYSTLHIVERKTGYDEPLLDGEELEREITSQVLERKVIPEPRREAGFIEVTAGQ
jgi:hypothetical protein